MKWTVSSFTSEHLQQSLQHCNDSISYDEPTGYGGRSSATGNAHLPQHRDRCGRWVSAHLQQEHADFQTSGIPLQMCKQESNITLFCSFATKDLVCIHFIIHCFMSTRFFASLWITRQKHRISCIDEHPNASREILQRTNAHSWIRQRVFIKTKGTFQKSLHLFEKM